MKKIIAFVLAVAMLGMTAIGCAETLDTYTSASLTKSYVEGEELDTLAKTLAVSGADIATKAQAEAEGYVKMYGEHVQIMTVNPDGCVGLSTIGYWRYADNREDGTSFEVKAGDWTFTNRGSGCDQVIIQLTEGQNALNLYNAGVGGRATLLVKLDSTVYLLHLNITETYEQKFDQAAYDAGEFANGYSGADRQASSFYFVFDVLSIEKSNAIIL